MSSDEVHHDALAISTHISHCLVKRILIDNGSSVNLIMMDSLKDMGYTADDVVKRSVPLVGFSGETKQSLGEISLSVYAEGLNK